MNRIARKESKSQAKSQSQRARRREHVVKKAQKKGNAFAAWAFGEALSNVKRWRKRYDGTWQSLLDRSHRPLTPHPKQHTAEEEALIRKAFEKNFFKYGWIEVYNYLVDELGYARSYWGMRDAARRMGLAAEKPKEKPPRKKSKRFPELKTPGEKVQIDVKEAPYNCLRGDLKRDGKHLYQWTAIDECTRDRFIYGYDEHSAENSVDFFLRLQAAFPFPIQCVQTDNGSEFTYKFISETERSPLDKLLDTLGIDHKLIPPRTPWHNGKVERSHRTDQRYFYDWEKFGSVEEFNEKLAIHLAWYNNRRMAVLGFISPVQRLATFAPDFCEPSSLRSSASQKSA